MNVTIRKIGNSEGIIIPKEVLDRLGLKAGDDLEMNAHNGSLSLQPTTETFKRQMDHAQKFMDRYKVTLKKLAE